ncbi:eukaryotic translation initiation factor 3 62 kda subunit [Moniliophthora roreri]|uniref:tRNA (adenine(58)-N(1))-methyltransferase non-catalytic subunit TRM6 n=1 Tax=Moniliophthora roreri TaxID=221103 RepID=A0A0W0F1I6_MONRR|nr:eukaryotic translation initiation factor 3 62 kda subunit [Moniliophthora roreri]
MDTQPEASTSQPTSSSSLKIQSGDIVMVRQPNGDVRSIKIERDSTVQVGRIGSFHANELMGQLYGFTYEIVSKKLKIIPTRSLEEVEDTDATNELINDGQFVQPLTLAEITALKQSGVHASDIIKKQIEQHANYSLKTEYSKEKYKKRKEAKYSKSFTTIEPTLFNVCDYWFKKDQNRIRDIRPDSLSQMLLLANIRPGGRYLAVDDASGLVVASILDRLGGEGRLLTICDTDSPPAYPVMANFNFRPEQTSIMTSLNWATAQEEYTPIMAPTEVPSAEIKSERQKSRLKKRKLVSDALMRTREELFAGEFEGLIVASQYDPTVIVERLAPYLAGSASIIVHSPHLQVVADLQAELRSLPGFLAPSVTEVWLRQYQVLPGRTHPTMNTSGSGGYILHVVKVYDDPNANSVVSHRQRNKKAKAENSDEGSSTPGPGASNKVES